MCLSTVYRNKKEDDCIAARYVDKISVDGNDITLIDVMGASINIEGRIKFADLTEGVIIIDE